MNPKYVTSLETSMKLKEVGVPQVSEWYWERLLLPTGKWGGWKIGQAHDHFSETFKNKEIERYSAYLVDELGEMLPIRHDITISIQKGSKVYHVNYWWGTPNPLRGEGVTDYWRTHNKIMAEAMGEMLLYLIENKLVSFEAKASESEGV